jgi:hypothetical protein
MRAVVIGIVHTIFSERIVEYPQGWQRFRREVREEEMCVLTL